MTWRFTQLQNSLCEQDQLILTLFENKKVRYIGDDNEFAQYLDCDNLAENLVLIINRAMWISEILECCSRQFTTPTDCFYIGINQYLILGNDTNLSADNPVDLIKQHVRSLGFDIVKHSEIQRDLGRQFNFVQPKTWVYGNKNTNQSH
jgi:hypothetical protein